MKMVGKAVGLGAETGRCQGRSVRHFGNRRYVGADQLIIFSNGGHFVTDLCPALSCIGSFLKEVFHASM